MCIRDSGNRLRKASSDGSPSLAATAIADVETSSSKEPSGGDALSADIVCDGTLRTRGNGLGVRRALRRPESMNRVDLPHPPLLAYWAPPTCPPHPAGAMADGAGDAIARPVRLSSSARSRANESSRGLYPRPSLVKLAVRDLALSLIHISEPTRPY